MLDATTGQNALAQAAQFHEAVGLTGIVAHQARRHRARAASLLTIAGELALPIRFIGIGEQAADIDVFDASEFADGADSARAEAPTAAESAP